MAQSVFDILNKKPKEEPQKAAPQQSGPSFGDYVSMAIPQPVKTTVSTVFDLLTRPVGALSGAALAQREGRDMSDAVVDNLAGRRKDSFMDVAAKDFGEDSFTGKALGFAGDVVADPLNLVGGAIPKALKAVAPVAKAAGNLAPEGVQRVAAGVRDALGEKFIPRYGTGITEADSATLAAAGKAPVAEGEFSDSLRMFQKERSTIPTRVEKSIIDRYKGTDLSQRDSATGVLEALEAGAGKTDEVDDLMLQQKQINDELFEREVRAGVQKPEAFNPDYAPHDYSRSKGTQAKISSNPNSVLNARNAHARKRVDPERTIQEAVVGGAADDVALAQLTREIKGNRAALTGEFVQRTAAKYGLPVDDAPVDWEVLKLPMEKPLAEQVSKIALPSYIAKELNKLYIPEREASMLGKIYDKTLRIWRTQATILRPGFHSTNAQGNLFNGAFLAGALNPMRFLEAAGWGRLKAKGFNGAPNMGRYTLAEVDDFMERFGVGGAGHSFTSELMEEGADEVLLAKLGNRAVTHRNPLKQTVHLAKRAGQGLEDFSKRALFFDRVHKGMSLEEAAKDVDKFLFDYSDLTDFERRVARRVFPFYCVPDTTLILTRDGWKGHHELVLGEETLTYNLERDELEWQPITGVAVFDHDQPLMTFNNTRVEFEFTHEHRWPVKVNETTVKGKTYGGNRKFVRGHELNSSHSIIMAAEFRGNSESLLTPEQARLLGWLLTDGYWRFRGNSIEAVIYQSPKKFLDEVLEVAGGKPREPHPDTGVIAVPVLQERLLPLKPYLERSKDGDWLPVISRLSREALDALRDAMYKGDGTTNGCNGSDFMACAIPQIRELYRVVEFLRGNRTSDSERGCYVSPRRTVKIAGGKLGERHYTGKVWCPQTPNGTWVMRQGNVISITGNTWSRKNIPLQAQQLAEQPGKYAAVAKTQNAIEREPQQDGTFIPPADRLEYLQKSGAVQIGGGPEGEARFWTPYLPYSDLNKLPVPGGSSPLETARDLASGIEPVSKALIELLQNKSLFFDRPLFDAELGPIGDRQKINDSLQLLPESVQRQLFTEVNGRGGKPEMQTPALVRYLLSQFPLVEGAGKAAVSLSRPEDAPNPYNWMSPTMGVRLTERDRQQVGQDRKAAQRERNRIRAKERKQAPRKADVKTLYERYRQAP